MAAAIIDGKKVAEKVRGEVGVRVAALKARGVTPGLAVVLVGENPASEVYVRNKTRAAREVGVEVYDHHLPDTLSQEALLALIGALNTDARVDGILVQLPLPKQIDSTTVLEAIDPRKDVDGFHPDNVGRLWSGAPRFVSCTPAGVMRLLAETGTNPNWLAGLDAIVIGRSNIVGKPMAALLLMANCTVTVAHSKTRDLPARVRAADVVIAAIGKAEFVRGDWIKEGATVIDVGINRENGKLVGDVEFAAAAERAAAITPVPGGVGPMTIAMLLSNTVDSATARAGR